LGRGVAMKFRELEDFHPDRIFEHHELFAKLREQRSSPGAVTAAQPQAPPPSPTPARMLPLGNLLDNILDDTDSEPAAASGPRDAMRDFIDRAVAPHLAPREDPRLPQAVAEVDAAAGKLMRAVLHHANFQALEAGWRAIRWLVRGLETGALLKVYLLDISKPDLAASLRGLHQVLVEQAEEPWALVAGNYTFGHTETDVRLLRDLAGIMHLAGAPFLAEGDPAGADSEQVDQLWEALRRSPGARSIGLALPRFLLRLPYGEDTDSVEGFAFEEMPGTPVHGNYLWANPAFACAYLLGQAFTSDGWDLRPGRHQEIGGLPLHVYKEDGEQQLKPCAEMLMTEEDAESIMDQGYMPLASIKGQDSVRLLRFQAIANPPAPLAGRWG
jgi:type VI secretion system protein ImpC